MTAHFPSDDDLWPLLEKLEREPRGVVLVALIADDSAPGFANASWGFFDAEERESLKRALTRCRAKRGADTLNPKEKPAMGSISPKKAPSIQ